ncbi:MAG: hypothetical protein QOH13_419, partial [Thermoleophilaceae bacterium]|nr:hypothetical protein [Thermoleophilaceae bacterium]
MKHAAVLLLAGVLAVPAATASSAADVPLAQQVGQLIVTGFPGTS